MLRYAYNAYISNMSLLLDLEHFQKLGGKEPEIIRWSKGTLEFCLGQNLGFRLEAGTKLNKRKTPYLPIFNVNVPK